jgi:hypothetical protein
MATAGVGWSAASLAAICPISKLIVRPEIGAIGMQGEVQKLRLGSGPGMAPEL